MAQFLRSCARPTRFAALAIFTALSGCGDAPAPPVPAPVAPPGPAPGGGGQSPFDDAPLRKAKDDAEKAMKTGDLLLQAQTLRIYATVLRARGRTEEASQAVLQAIALSCEEWTSDDAARRETAAEEIDAGCGDLEELINRGIIKKAVTHGQAVAWYGQVQAQMARVKRRAHAAALRHQQSHHAANAERLDEAAAWAAEAVAERRALGLRVPAAWSLNQLGHVQLLQGQHAKAWVTLGEAAQSVCGRGLNAVARATIQNVAAVIRSHIEAGIDEKTPDPARLAQGKQLLRDLWFVAGGDGLPEPKRPGWTAAEQSFVLSLSKELHMLAGDLDAAEQALLAMLWISHRGNRFRPDVDAALWLEMAIFAEENRSDYPRALRYCDTSMALHELIDHELGIGWVRNRRASVRLKEAEAAKGAADRLKLVEQAITEAKSALQRFRACGNHRNGRLMAIQLLQRADQLRDNPDGAQSWAEQAVKALGEPPPAPAEPHHFPPVDEMWKGLAAKLSPSAPLVDVVRDADGWIITDLVDNTAQRVAFVWRDRAVHVRLFELHLGGATLGTPARFGGYSLFVPKFHGAQILRNGLIIPAGPKLKGAADLDAAKHKVTPPMLKPDKPGKGK